MARLSCQLPVSAASVLDLEPPSRLGRSVRGHGVQVKRAFLQFITHQVAERARRAA